MLRRVPGVVLGLCNLTYAERLIKNGLPTMVYRRWRSDVIHELDEIMQRKYDTRFNPRPETHFAIVDDRFLPFTL